MRSLVSPEEHELNCAVSFGFKATDNVGQYETLLVGLRLAMEMQVKRLVISNDSHVIVIRQKFNNKKVRNLCEELGIRKHFFLLHHPQANGKVKAIKKTINYMLKRNLDASKGV
ncbi:unnamed protein product [Fraxinus pennsylvanica]|uniref:RNase H type-1 domain-containing protein n=1 Tax=Fraxinus pennsylvanica TaxID=56036 RepID=A0AAD1ZZV2_9LAMI|nr:unnamed protein product [Fraxinus pennsylvanica]